MLQHDAGPGATGEHRRPAGDAAVLGDHGADPAAAPLDGPDRALLVDRHAGAAQAAGHGGHGEARLGAGIARGVQGTSMAGADAGCQRVGLLDRQQAAVELVGLGVLEPGREARRVGIVLDEIGDPTDLPADVLAERCGDLCPELEAADDQRQLCRITALLANPAPVARRLLAGDAALLAEHHGHAQLLQEPGGRDAGNAAADDDDLGRLRHISVDRHWPAVSATAMVLPGVSEDGFLVHAL